MMNVGVCQWVFNKMYLDGDIDMLGCIEFVGRETEADCFEPLNRYWAKAPDVSEQATHARALLDEVGLAVSSYTLDSSWAVYDEDGPQRCAETIIGELDIALLLGTDHIRLDPGTALPADRAADPDMDYILARMAEGMALVADVAADLDIKVGIENHGMLVGKVALVKRLIELIDRPNLGANIDPTNFYVVHGEDHIEGTRILADRATHVHLKDGLYSEEPMDEPWREVPGGIWTLPAVGGEGDAQWATLLGILRDAGYDGTVSLETSVADDIFGSVKQGVTNLKRAIAEVEASA